MTTINLLSWNVNGIRAIHQKGFLPWLIKAKPGILCLQETRAEESQLPVDLAQPSGYRLFSASCLMSSLLLPNINDRCPITSIMPPLQLHPQSLNPKPAPKWIRQLQKSRAGGVKNGWKEPFGCAHDKVPDVQERSE